MNPFLPTHLQERLVLASASARRKSILESLGFQFEIIPPRIEEDVIWDDPERRAVLLAELKGVEVQRNRPRSTIVAADTIVSCNGDILGKPGTDREAAGMMETLSGRSHQVITGVVLLHPPSHRITGCRSTTVFFKELSGIEIEQYIDTGEPFGKAGGYAIQGYASAFVEGIEGCFFNVVGLPVFCLFSMFRELEGRVYEERQ